jgi:hypothetical protein
MPESINQTNEAELAKLRSHPDWPEDAIALALAEIEEGLFGQPLNLLELKAGVFMALITQDRAYDPVLTIFSSRPTARNLISALVLIDLETPEIN